MDIQTAVAALIDRHGGVRPAARVLGINYAYLSRLHSGAKSNPTDRVLRKLGLRKIVTYETIRPVRTVLMPDGLEMKAT